MNGRAIHAEMLALIERCASKPDDDVIDLRDDSLDMAHECKDAPVPKKVVKIPIVE